MTSRSGRMSEDTNFLKSFYSNFMKRYIIKNVVNILKYESVNVFKCTKVASFNRKDLTVLMEAVN